MIEDEMVGWHLRLKGHKFEQTPGVGDTKKQPSYDRREPSPHYKEEQKIPLCDGRTESPERTVSLRLPQCHVSVSEPS